MFTGLVETTGVVREVRPGRRAVTLCIAPQRGDYEVAVGDSVAVNGVCLTVESCGSGAIRLTAVSETLAHTTLGRLRVGETVNLERALRLSDRLGGHIVLGHVDGVGRLVGDQRVGESIVRTVWVPSELRVFMALKGSVAIDGVSLTISATSEETIAVSLIPHTMECTTLMHARPGQSVNLECDVLARYIFHQLRRTRGATPAAGGASDADLLRKMETLGF